MEVVVLSGVERGGLIEKVVFGFYGDESLDLRWWLEYMEYGGFFDIM